MKLKYDFVINQVAGETVAVSVGNSDFSGYIKLNETGAFIFKALKKDVTREQIIDALLKQYPDATCEEVSESVEDLLQKLSEAELLI